jgi:hypothetical protein
MMQYNIVVGCYVKMLVNVAALTFTGPSILIHSYNKSQQDALFLKFILL